MPPMQTLPLVGLDAIRDAATRLEGVAQRTPMELSRAMSRALGRQVWLKCEHLQRTGSFKIRGAYNRISRIPDADRARGVVCASAGNHAQGVALSAQLLGVTATVYMPTDAPLPKIEATRAYGAEVVLGGANVDEALAAATAHADRTGATFVHPFDHPDVIAGQGTLGLEILEQEPEVRTAARADRRRRPDRRHRRRRSRRSSPRCAWSGSSPSVPPAPWPRSAPASPSRCPSSPRSPTASR